MPLLLLLILCLPLNLNAQSYYRNPAYIEGITTTAKATGTTTLTSASQTQQNFIGTNAQTVVLPSATTLDLGRKFYIYNAGSAGDLTVNDASAGLVTTIKPLVSKLISVRSVGSASGIWIVLGNIDISGITGILPIANGGSNKALTLAAGGVLWTDSDSFEVSAPGSSGQLLQSTGTTAPAFTTATYPSTATGTGNLLRADGTNWVATTLTYPNTAASPSVMVANTSNTVTALAASTPSRLLRTNGTTLAFSQADLTTDVTGTLPVTNGGTGASAFTLGSVVYAGASGVYTQDNTNFFWDATNLRLGIGAAAAPTAGLTVGGTTRSGTPSITGELINTVAHTYTDSNTAGSGTAANFTASAFNTTTLAATNSNVTTTSASNLRIAGPVIASTNETIGTSVGLDIGTANVTSGVTTATAFRAAVPTGATNNYAGVFTGGPVGIATAVPTALLTIGSLGRSGTPGTTGFNFYSNPGNFTDNNTAISGTAANYTTNVFANNSLLATNATVTTTIADTVRILGGVAASTNETITNSSTLRLAAANVAAGTVNSYALVLAPNTGATNNYGASISGNVGMGGATDPQTMLDIAATGVTANTSEQLSLRSSRSAIVSGNLIGGISYKSNDTNLTAPGTVVAIESAVAEATHTASVLDTGIAFYTTKTLAIAEKMRLDADGDLGLGIASSIDSTLFIDGDTDQTQLKVQANATQTATGVVYEDSAGSDQYTFLFSTSNENLYRGANPAGINLNRANTSLASPSIVASGDNLGSYRFQGYDGSAYQIAGEIRATVNGTPGASDMPGKVSIFVTPDGSATPAERLTVTEANGTMIRGTTTNDSAAAGDIGEYVSASNTAGAGNTYAGGTPSNFPATGVAGCDKSISLTAGDWDVQSSMAISINGATLTAGPEMWIGTASGNSTTGRDIGANYVSGALLTGTTSGSAFDGWVINTPVYRVSLSATTTYYLKCRASFSIATPTYYHTIRARRIR